MALRYNPKNGKLKPKIIIHKQNTTTEDEYYNSIEESSSESDESEIQSSSEILSQKRFHQEPYNKPSKQNLYTPEIIQDKIQGYIPLTTMQDKKKLINLVPHNVWIKYFNEKLKKFRTGGLLIKVEYPKYITLLNPTLKLTWCVQLDENIIFIPDVVKKNEKLETERKKEKLYEYYLQKKLILKDD